MNNWLQKYRWCVLDERSDGYLERAYNQAKYEMASLESHHGLFLAGPFERGIRYFAEQVLVSQGKAKRLWKRLLYLRTELKRQKPVEWV